MTRNPYLPIDPAPRPARAPLPDGSCDCHFHVFEDPVRYPLGADRSYTPTLASWPDYERMTAALGLTRGVLVHPSVYGSDHRSFEDCLAAHPQRLRGVAVAAADTPLATLERWHALGTRGTRCNALFRGGASIDSLPAIADRVRDLGWHLQLLIDVDADPGLLPRIVELGLPVVVDHFGHTPADRALHSAGFANLLSLLREGRCWVKISGAYRVTADRLRFSDMPALCNAIVDANPAQIVWGTDWPHPAISPPMHNDGDLTDLLFDWLSPALRQAVLVDNPTRLYWA